MDYSVPFDASWVLAQGNIYNCSICGHKLKSLDGSVLCKCPGCKSIMSPDIIKEQ